MDKRRYWSRILITVGGICMLIGAVDPLEGSLLILPGSGLFLLGAFVGQCERRIMVYRLWVFILIAIGVGAVWGLSMAGGFGDNGGVSMWWGILVLPYLVGWSLGIWGSDSPRWLLVLGIVVSLWYLAIPVMTLNRSSQHVGDMSAMPGIVLGATGALTLGGCILRLRKKRFGRQFPE